MKVLNRVIYIELMITHYTLGNTEDLSLVFEIDEDVLGKVQSHELKYVSYTSHFELFIYSLYSEESIRLSLMKTRLNMSIC